MSLTNPLENIDPQAALLSVVPGMDPATKAIFQQLVEREVGNRNWITSAFNFIVRFIQATPRLIQSEGFGEGMTLAWKDAGEYATRQEIARSTIMLHAAMKSDPRLAPYAAAVTGQHQVAWNTTTAPAQPESTQNLYDQLIAANALVGYQPPPGLPRDSLNMSPAYQTPPVQFVPPATPSVANPSLTPPRHLA